MAIKKVLTTDLFNQYTTEQIKPYVDTKSAASDTKVATEKARAEAAESTLTTAISTEKTRATTKETELTTTISTLNNAAVKVTGEQTIGGNKTFTNDVKINGDLKVNPSGIKIDDRDGGYYTICYDNDQEGLGTAAKFHFYADVISDSDLVLSGELTDGTNSISVENICNKSTVSVSNTGTATDEISYITVNGVEKKIASGSTVKKSSPQVRTAPIYGSVDMDTYYQISEYGEIWRADVIGPNGTTTDTFNTFLNSSVIRHTFDFTNHNYYWALNSSTRYGAKKTILERQNKYSGLKFPQDCHSSKDFVGLRKQYDSQITTTPVWKDILVLVLGETFVDELIANNPSVSYKLISSRYNNNTETFSVWIDHTLTLDDDLKDTILNETKAHVRRKRNRVWFGSGRANLDCKLMIVRDVTKLEGTQYIPTDVVAYLNFVHIYITESFVNISISKDLSKNCNNN